MRVGHAYRYKEIIIGATLDSAMYAYKNKMPIFFLNRRPPHKFEFTSSGVSKLELYKKLMFLLSLNGYIPIPTEAAFLQVEDNMLSIATKNGASIEVQFEQAAIFDEYDLAGLDAGKQQQKKYLVMDWFNVRSGACHPHTRIESASDFVKRIQFYPSERIDGTHDKKDLVSFSYLDENNAESFEYSETYVRLKVLNMMKAAGIKGAKNGRHPKSGTQKYRSLKIESAQREKIDLTRPIHDDTETITFMWDKHSDADIESTLRFLK